MCYFPHCSLETLDETQIPESMRRNDLTNLVFPRYQPDLPVFRRYDYDENDFCVVDGECNKGSYVNLIDNPERFTGYAGEPAYKVWRAIYEENCFLEKPFTNPLSRRSLNNQCYEKRAFFKVISGFHASVSVHIADSYFNSTTMSWGKNFELFHERVGVHPDRLQNMYLVFLLLFRAIEKLGPRLEDYKFGLEDEKGELHTRVS